MENEPVTIILDEGAELPARLIEFERQFTECFDTNKFNIILDMHKIKLPPTRFIVTLIEATCVARRMGGDIKLTNLNPLICNNLVTFSPRTYLSIEASEQYALMDFGETFEAYNKFDISDNVFNEGLISNDHIMNIPSSEREEQPGAHSSIQKLIDIASEKIRVNSKVENLYEICDFVLEMAKKAGYDIRERGKIKVTVYEACLNVIEHAYFSNPEHWIDVRVGYNQEKLIIIIQDWGESFNFDPSKSYDVEQAVKDRRTGGFGLHIIRRSVDEINYLSDPEQGNRLILVKYLK